jgi:dTDP-4-amino-4,6-dideoxygalactose transaminase
VLAPAWHHGSEIEALVRSGLHVRFYDSAPAVHPAPEELPVSTETRAVHLTHVLGFPAPADRWRRFCDERGLLLIEDAAQAWMAGCAGRPAGAWGDLAVFCLYKMVGLPEGAVFVTHATSPPGEPLIDPRFGLREHGLVSVAWILARSASLHAAALKLRGRRRREYDHHADMALRDPSAGPWRPTRFLLDRLADPHIAELRRERYARLLTRLRPLVPAPFDELPADACPFALPIEVDDKEAVLEGLQARGVLALNFWSLPHPSLESAKHPRAARRRERTIGLPVHQELRARDVDRIADVVEQVVSVAL